MSFGSEDTEGRKATIEADEDELVGRCLDRSARKIVQGTFDAIYSDLGVLNCMPDLESTARGRHPEMHPRRRQTQRPG